MVKFKIEKGVSRITRVKLQAAIEESIAADINLLCEWSNNEKNYVVNELLRFALAQNTDFQVHKDSRTAQPQGTRESAASSANPKVASQLGGGKSPIESDSSRSGSR
jgi:hypothetical protein